ncbi:MAG: threonyl-tRNA synthetase editing domain-containing protein, partial [Infirmifilum sp.]
MKLLLIHAKSFEYEAREKALEGAEDIDGRRIGKAENALVVFVTVEEGDSSDPGVVSAAVREIEDVFRRVKASEVVVYP